MQDEAAVAGGKGVTSPSCGQKVEADLRRLHHDVLQAKDIAAALTKEVSKLRKHPSI